MSDWEPLASSLAKSRPGMQRGLKWYTSMDLSVTIVLIYDHRGIGESSFANSAGDQVTIELMGRDLLELLASLRWTRLAICGFSMGGESPLPDSELLT